jgi:hypothetical protein
MTEDLIILSLNEIWKCDVPFGWVPITGDEKIPDTEIYQSNHFQNNIPDISNLLSEVYQVTEVYEIQEGGIVKLKKTADCVFSYDGLEYIYTDKKFQFVLYYSHESSVTVGGKKLIDAIRYYWPEYKNHIWTSPFFD